MQVGLVVVNQADESNKRHSAHLGNVDKDNLQGPSTRGKGFLGIVAEFESP